MLISIKSLRTIPSFRLRGRWSFRVAAGSCRRERHGAVASTSAVPWSACSAPEEMVPLVPRGRVQLRRLSHAYSP